MGCHGQSIRQSMLTSLAMPDEAHEEGLIDWLADPILPF
jgi:hypothetical protein